MTDSHQSLKKGQVLIREQSGRSVFLGLWDTFCLSPLPYFAAYILVYAFYYCMKHYDSYWIVPWIAFSLIPALDLLIPLDLAHPHLDGRDPSLHSIWYKVPLFLWPLASAFVLVSCMWRVSVSHIDPLSVLQVVGMIVTSGLASGGIGITVAHELFHKPIWLDRLCGYILLLQSNYMHFLNEHLHGHHLHVATPNDPASARRGQSIWQFIPQTLVGSWNSSWKIEEDRLKKLYKNPPLWRNSMVWFAIIPCVYAACISLYLNSWMAFVFFYAQSTVGFLLLEIVNYVEHYGLARKKLDDGSYEPVNVCHSWNAPHAITNFFLFKLQRHSDHHAFSLRPYQVLRNFADSPQLPTGYAGMIILSLFPSIFFKVMDNRLKNEVNSEIRLKKDDLRPVIQKKNTSLFEFVVFLSIAAAPNLLFLV